MKIQLWSIGKSNEDYIENGIRLFRDRIRHYADFELKIIPGPKEVARFSIPDLKKREAKIILEQLQGQDYLAALDENGKELSTMELSGFLQQRMNAGVQRMIFLIGGAYGLDGEILDKAQQTLSLSRLTFPHQLVRLIVTEQLYRAFTILRNEKYHHQ